MTHPRQAPRAELDPRGTSRPPTEVPEAVRIRMLGGFSVSVGLKTIEESKWRLRKAANLVKLLALTPGHRLHREQATNLLWTELDEKAAANNLYQALHVARRVLEPEAAAASSYLRLQEEQLELCPNNPLWIDIEAFEQAAKAAQRSGDPAVYQAAIDLYAGYLLPEDPYEDWAEERREELRLTHLSLLIEIAGLYEQRGDIGAATETLQKVVAAESAHEEAHAGLMRLYAKTGQRYQALRQYEQLRQALARELDTQPDAQSKRLYEDILAGRAVESPSDSLPPAEPPDVASKHNLPGSLTSFIGREREKEEIKRLLATTRLLTLAGAGGSGKTRLALEVARGLVEAYPDGMWLAELASLSEGTLVPQAVAAALGIPEQPNRPLTDTLVDALRPKRMVLVLDNCEHLVQACAHLAEVLLGSCPSLRILATSREILGAAGEVIWRVPSLSRPDPWRRLMVEELAGYESVRLFVERARYRNPAFTLTQENAEAVAEICSRLDGIPLAIELAAARAGLSVEQIAERLDDSLRLLTAGRRTAPPRHKTIRGTLEWSYDLLSEPERRLFGRLSVFAGGWTLEAAEKVVAGDGIEEGDVLDLLSGLVDKSLVLAEATGDGGVRYRVLEPVRQYARERQEEGSEAETVRRRHAAFFLALAEQAEPELAGRNQSKWLDRLEAEHSNLRAALGWSLEQDVAEPGLRLASAVWMFWHTHGHLSEGRAWLERAISAGSTPHTKAKALIGVGWISMFQGDYEAAKTFFEKGLALFRELGDEDGIVTCTTNLGLVAVLGERRDIPVLILLEEATRLRPKLTNPHTITNLLILSGLVAFAQGDIERAWALHEESLELSRETGNMGGTTVCLTNLGLMAVGRGDHTRATTLLQENLHLARRADDKVPLQYALFGLAGVAAARGQPARAARLWGASEAVREVAGLHLTALARTGTNYEAHLDAARSQLGEAAFDEAWAEGRAMPQEEAVEYALSKEAPATTVPASEKAPADALTRREREVAILVARGLTNSQIARELSISERTVHGHMRKVLKKLELRSRAHVAAWVTQRRLDAAGRD